VRNRIESAPAEPRVHYTETDVLTADEMCVALRISKRQWSRVAPTLPVSYALGKQSPRYIYGEVLNFLRKTGAAA
jgi:hypothetical protein